MTDAVPEAETTKAPRAKLPWIVAMVVVVALLTGVAVAVAWTGGGNRGAGATAAPSATWMQDACQEWMGNYTGAAPPNSMVRVDAVVDAIDWTRNDGDVVG
jgi:flagellar basal body-associated protein FliL